MNLLLVSADEIGDDGRVRLVDRRAEHLGKILKVEPGQRLRVGLLGGGVGEGEVVTASRRETTLVVDLPSEPIPPTAFDLIVALPRPQALHRVLQTAAAMGVGRLDLVNAWRVEKSYFSTPSLRPETIWRHLLLGAEQGMWPRLPEVEIHHRLVPFVESLGERGIAGQGLIAHPEAEGAIEDEISSPGRMGGRTAVAIGPEGGWIDREIRTFGEVGFLPVRLGGWILRVENAVIAALAQLELLARLGPRLGPRDLG